MTAREQVDGANLSQAHVHATDTTQRACTTVSRGTAFGPPCGYHLQWGIRMCKRCGPFATREEGSVRNKRRRLFVYNNTRSRPVWARLKAQVSSLSFSLCSVESYCAACLVQHRANMTRLRYNAPLLSTVHAIKPQSTAAAAAAAVPCGCRFVLAFQSPSCVRPRNPTTPPSITCK